MKKKDKRKRLISALFTLDVLVCQKAELDSEKQRHETDDDQSFLEVQEFLALGNDTLGRNVPTFPIY